MEDATKGKKKEGGRAYASARGAERRHVLKKATKSEKKQKTNTVFLQLKMQNKQMQHICVRISTRQQVSKGLKYIFWEGQNSVSRLLIGVLCLTSAKHRKPRELDNPQMLAFADPGTLPIG